VTRAVIGIELPSRLSVGRTSMSPNPFDLRCSMSFANCLSDFMFGTSRKSTFARATAGFTVFEPSPV